MTPGNLMLDIAKECHVTDRCLSLSRKPLTRVKDPFVAEVPEVQSSTLMRRWKDDHERAKHLIAAWGVDVRLEE
jgi:hypothetical protein